ncbi:MAG TPA: hypothetical protein VN763_17045, partial [Saprospiraceae bacterium]|nr:hypothetical protein [Saprospiraceae bacterium]
MGIVPQTVGNGLKPYGMLYDLIRNFNVPIKWVINPSKIKDGIDFTHNGTNFSGGPFIIPAEYRTSAVNARISFWQGQGVQGVTTVSPITVPVYTTLTNTPHWTLNTDNSGIPTGFFSTAGIPTTSYTISDATTLTCCSDIFVMPHADPAWATHGQLLDWNLNCKGGIWFGCSAGSHLSDMFNPASPSSQTNFLSEKTVTASGSGPYFQNSLVLASNHADGAPPYLFAYPTDPQMQFMGSTAGAMENGAEQVYLPVIGGGWRSSTKVAVWDPDQQNIPALSAGLAAKVAYGPGMGDPNRGQVLLSAGHDQNGNGTGNVAALRIFFNHSFLNAKAKGIDVVGTGIPNSMTC